MFYFQCSCRTQQNLSELPLSAHLLAPIQRICRYPLHLSELVKHSPSKQDLIRMHEDEDERSLDIDACDSKETFELALAAMKRVTEMVNEGNFEFFGAEMAPNTLNYANCSFMQLIELFPFRT